MKNKTGESEQRQELVHWLLQRFENHKNSISNRSAIVLSADAILLAGNFLFIDKLLSNVSHEIFYPICMMAIFLSICCIFISIESAIKGIANVTKLARNSFLEGLPGAIFFHAPSTIDNFKDFDSFREGFRKLSDVSISNYALLELWTVITQHHRRYPMLAKSIRFLTYSVIPIFIALFCLILDETLKL